MRGCVKEMGSQSGDRLLEASSPSFNGRNTLYTVSVRKFAMLYLFTLGGYTFYWSYRNWAAYRNATGVDVMPVMRGLFWPFFIFALFEKIQNRLGRMGRSYCWNPKPRAVLVLLVLVMLVLLLWFISLQSGGIVSVAGSVALIAGGLFLFVGAQRAINLLEKGSKGNCNAVLTAANKLWMAGGGLFALYLVFQNIL